MINRANSGYCICGHSIEDHELLGNGASICIGDSCECQCYEYEEAPLIGFTDEDAVDAPSHKRNTD